MKKVYKDRIVYKNDQGQIHHLDGPAVEWSNGAKEWFIDGKKHREDGPAIEQIGYKAWCVNDKFHREDGPAIEYYNGVKRYYLNNINYTEEEFHQEVIKLKLNRLVNL